MDKIKNLLHKDKNGKDVDTSGATGNISGEGSHFGGASGTGAQYGAAPGVGISSFTDDQKAAALPSSTATTSSTTTATSAAATATTSTIGSAPLVSNTATGFPSKPSDDIASVASVKSGVQGIGGANADTLLAQNHPAAHPSATAPPSTTTTGAASHVTGHTATGLTGTAIADRSIPAGNSATVAEPYTERAFPLASGSTTATATATGLTSGSGTHSTFTGERLDTTPQLDRSFYEPGLVSGVGAGGASTAGTTTAGTTTAGAIPTASDIISPSNTVRDAAAGPATTGAPVDGVEKKHSVDNADTDTGRDAVIAGGAGGAAGATGAAVEHEKHKHDKHEQDDETGEKKKHGFLGSLLHRGDREQPNKLHKDPPGGEVAPVTHETFVRPGPNHEQHIGTDGMIGRRDEASGVGGTDARHTMKAADLPADV